MAREMAQRAADAKAQEQAQLQPLEDSRGIVNTSIFAYCFDACLHETIATYLADWMNSPLNVTQQRAVLKTFKSFQREIKAISDEPGSFVSQLCRDSQHLAENAKKMVFGTDRAALPNYFYTKIRALEDARWNLFFTQLECIHVFHNHFSENGKKNMSLDGKLALSDVSLNKSDFNHIPVAVAARLVSYCHIPQEKRNGERARAIRVESTSAQLEK
jgi:hypothetical protein